MTGRGSERKRSEFHRVSSSSHETYLSLTKMDAAKKSRKIQRTLFKKRLNSFLDKCKEENVTPLDQHFALQLLESRMAELGSVNTKYSELLIFERKILTNRKRD